MRPICLSLLMLCVAGCAHQYVMKLSNGMEMTCPGKPKLKGGYYYYKGPHGEPQAVPQSRVRVIEPASMAKEESQFKVSSPQKKHWYWPF